MTDILRCRQCGKILAITNLPEKISSVEIAHIFHKHHRRVMQDIRKILASGEGLHAFVQSSYTNKQKNGNLVTMLTEMVLECLSSNIGQLT